MHADLIASKRFIATSTFKLNKVRDDNRCLTFQVSNLTPTADNFCLQLLARWLSFLRLFPTHYVVNVTSDLLFCDL